MKIEIKYFTSTGNTLWMARYARDTWQAQGHHVRLSNVERDGMEFQDDSQLVGIFYPVWGSNFPAIIGDHILQTKPSDRKMFLIGNCAMFTGDTGIHWKRKIEAALGYDVFYIDHVLLPMNVNIPNFNWLKVPHEEKKRRIFAKAEKHLDRILDGIVAGRRRQRGHQPLGILGAKVQRHYEKALYRYWQEMMTVDTAQCTDCGLCTRLCPTNNIQLDNGQLVKEDVFYDQCIFCLRCYNLCPRNAYLVGEATKDVKRYSRYKGAYLHTAKTLLED